MIKTNLTVVDSSPRPYDKLNKADIKVFENEVEQEIVSLEMINKPLDLLIMMDSSRSTRLDIEELSELAIEITRLLEAEDSISVVRFVGRDNISVLVDWTDDRSAVRKSIDENFVESGQTAFLDALFFSSQKIKARKIEKPARSQMIVIISDMEDRDSLKNIREVAETIDPNTPIFIIQPLEQLENSFPVNSSNYKKAVSLGQNLAYITGGDAYRVEEKVSRKNLEYSLRKLEVELKRNYVLKYLSKNKSFNGKTRKLRVEIADPENKGQISIKHKTEFILPK